jgi:antitoxin YefM
MKAIKQKGIVSQNGKLEIHSQELTEGMEVEIIILIPSSDTTEYLLSTEANRRELSEAITRVENNDNLVRMSIEEWNEKYSF